MGVEGRGGAGERKGLGAGASDRDRIGGVQMNGKTGVVERNDSASQVTHAKSPLVCTAMLVALPPSLPSTVSQSVTQCVPRPHR